MKNVPTPSVPDLARARGDDVGQLISWFVEYYNGSGVPWNYVTGTLVVRDAYRGFWNMRQLFAACQKEKNAVGRKSNEELVECAAPIAFGRKLQVFDLPKQKFQFGRNLHASYRIPFFFLEDKIVKLYFLQPRRGFCLSFEQICMVATIHKRYLLDFEFFGQKSDVEYVDLSAPQDVKDRDVRFYSLHDLALWPEGALNQRLEMIAEALDYIDTNDLARPRRRPSRHDETDMSLF